MERIPIVQIDDFLLVSIQVDLHDKLALTLQDELMHTLLNTRAVGVLVDISALDIVDSFIGRVLSDIAAMTQTMGAIMVLVGMQPAVAMTIVELGLPLKRLLTALNLDKAIGLLHKALPRNAARDGDGCGVL